MTIELHLLEPDLRVFPEPDAGRVADGGYYVARPIDKPKNPNLKLAEQGLATDDANVLKAYDAVKAEHRGVFGRHAERAPQQHLEKARALSVLLERYTSAAQPLSALIDSKGIKRHYYRIYYHLRKSGMDDDAIKAWIKTQPGINLRNKILDGFIKKVSAAYSEQLSLSTHYNDYVFNPSVYSERYRAEISLNQSDTDSIERKLRLYVQKQQNDSDTLYNLTQCKDLDCGCLAHVRDDFNERVYTHVAKNLLDRGEITYVTFACENIGTDVVRLQNILKQYETAGKPLPKVNFVCVDLAYKSYLDSKTIQKDIVTGETLLRAKLTQQTVDDLTTWSNTFLPDGSTVAICANARSAKHYLDRRGKRADVVVGEGYYEKGASPITDYAGCYNTDRAQEDFAWLSKEVLATHGQSFELTQNSRERTNTVVVRNHHNGTLHRESHSSKPEVSMSAGAGHAAEIGRTDRGAGIESLESSTPEEMRTNPDTLLKWMVKESQRQQCEQPLQQAASCEPVYKQPNQAGTANPTATSTTISQRLSQ